MSVDRSMRNGLAAILLVAAVFIAMNQLVASAPLMDWWLPLVLLLLGLGLVFAPRIGRSQPDTSEYPPPALSGIQTYEVTALAPRPSSMTAIEPEAVLPFEADSDVSDAPAELVDAVAPVSPETPAPAAEPIPELEAEPTPVSPETPAPAAPPEPVPVSPETPTPDASVVTETTAASADDLTRLSGVGRKSAAALQAAGIDSFQKLADTSDDTLRTALTSAGVRLVGDVDTWSQQAGYAARGDWDGLKRFNAERKSANGD